MNRKIKILKGNDFERYYNKSYYTIMGTGGDLDKWVAGYNEWLVESGCGTPVNWITFKGKDVNKWYKLEGNAYPDDLVFLAFPLDNLNLERLAIFRIKHKDVWFNDMIDHVIEHEEACID